MLNHGHRSLHWKTRIVPLYYLPFKWSKCFMEHILIKIPIIISLRPKYNFRILGPIATSTVPLTPWNPLERPNSASGPENRHGVPKTSVRFVSRAKPGRKLEPTGYTSKSVPVRIILSEIY